MYDKLKNKESKIAVIGLGYVGLPIALEFAKTMSVIGFDINEKRVDMMKNNIDPSEELDSSAFEGCDIQFTAKLEDLGAATFFVVAVPTPINSNKLPDLTPLIGASTTVGKVLKKGDYVVFESTVYPGCTEDDCIPILEEVSGLKWKEDFMVGYSPERINPGDTKHTLKNVIKVVSGCCDTSLAEIAKVYEEVVQAGVHRATSIKVAEAAKIIENTQRDLNIALVNELSIIFNKMDINTYDVLEAAGTKWNFLKFFPGLVGGHCIGVDPYYLTYKAKELGYHAQIINAGRFVNDSMGGYIAKQTVKKVIASGHHISESKILVMGATFKEDVSDIRNSKVVDVINELVSYGATVEVVDPHADSDSLKEEYGFGLVKEMANDYDAVIVAVNHKDYQNFDEEYFKSITSENPVIVDIKGIYGGKINNLTYWSL
ncbi:MAG: UDP-N-acetyl-D-galactosamine dehydrogenase [Flavobacteriales bacterium]|nr:MAG: UDP-N-acetyl-D-galactosamine dehydrogenase [Flavobacteriales bacterium]